MLSKIHSYGLQGIDGFMVDVEVDITTGLPQFEMVGLADTAIKEAKERVRSAIKNSGYDYPSKRITVNLAPADRKKEGPLYDLPIAIGLLLANGKSDLAPTVFNNIKKYVVVGELSLNGDVKSIKGLLPIIISARGNGFTNFIIPRANMLEASYVDGINAYPVKDLREVMEFLAGEKQIERVVAQKFEPNALTAEGGLDFKYVKGQARAKRALEIASAGGHNVLMIGPPGSGKSMLAKCFPSILPDMTFEEALEVTKIHSIAGELDFKKGIVSSRPFRSPHHSASSVSLVGGGSHSKPGESVISRRNARIFPPNA